MAGARPPSVYYSAVGLFICALSECLLAALTGSAGEFTNFKFPAKKFVFDRTRSIARSFCPFFLPVLFACARVELRFLLRFFCPR